MKKRAKINLSIILEVDYDSDLVSPDNIVSELQYEIDIWDGHADVATKISTEIREYHLISNSTIE